MAELGHYPNFWIDFSEPGLNDPNYSGDGIDRSRWKFEEGGFSAATNAALLAAQQQMREKIRSVNDDIRSIAHPVDYDVKVDGVPIDKANIER
jgi:hypothetical protein